MHLLTSDLYITLSKIMKLHQDDKHYIVSMNKYRLNPVGATASTRDNETLIRRRSFIWRHLFILAGMVTIGSGFCTTSAVVAHRG